VSEVLFVASRVPCQVPDYANDESPGRRFIGPRGYRRSTAALVETASLRSAGVMTLHKLTAGDGYTYLTRQVAAFDATERGHVGLGDYYSQRGESPGRWAGNGLRMAPEDVGRRGRGLRMGRPLENVLDGATGQRGGVEVGLQHLGRLEGVKAGRAVGDTPGDSAGDGAGTPKPSKLAMPVRSRSPAPRRKQVLGVAAQLSGGLAPAMCLSRTDPC
jgi:hypothetical protein